MLLDLGYTVQEVAIALSQIALTGKREPIEPYTPAPEYDDMLLYYPETEDI